MLKYKANMKKCLFLLLLISLFFISCSNAGVSKLSYTDVDTIRDTVKDREAQVSWTRELEGSRLTEEIGPDKALYSEDVKYTKLISKLNQSKQSPVFPEYPDFGLLDTSLLNTATKEAVNNFCQGLDTEFYTKPQTFFDNSYIFNFIFFRNDFVEGWEKFFSEDFPVTLPEKENEKNKEEDSEEELISIFTKWQLGEPFIGEEIIQLPVRFYCKPGIVDVTLYLNKKNLIYQISIDRWESL